MLRRWVGISGGSHARHDSSNMQMPNSINRMAGNK